MLTNEAANPDFLSDAAGGRPARAVQSWARHIRATIALAIPLIGSQLAMIAMAVTDTVMIGWLGAEALAASVLGTQAFFLVYIFGGGFAQAVMPIAASAEGNGDVRGVRRSVRMGLWVMALYSVAMMPLLWNIEPILRALGQQPDTARVAGDYMHVAQWSLPPALMVMALRSYLAVVGRAWVALAIVVVGVACNGLLNWVLIFGNLGAPAMGVVGAGLATTLTNFVMAALILGYTAGAAALRRYELYVRFWRPDWVAFREVLRLGWPIGATIIAEVSLFSASSIMMGWIGTVPLAAHGIALQIASVAFMIPLGIGSAGTVRVGVAFGRDDRANLGRAGYTALGLGALIALGSAGLFWILPERIVGLYLDDAAPGSAEVLGYAVPLLLVAAAFQMFDSLQAVANGLLRGLKDTRVPMVIAVFSYWGVGMPVAWAFAFPLDLGGVGIWTGLALGLAVAAVLLSARFMLRDRFGLLQPGRDAA